MSEKVRVKRYTRGSKRTVFFFTIYGSRKWIVQAKIHSLRLCNFTLAADVFRFIRLGRFNMTAESEVREIDKFRAETVWNEDDSQARMR